MNTTAANENSRRIHEQAEQIAPVVMAKLRNVPKGVSLWNFRNWISDEAGWGMPTLRLNLLTRLVCDELDGQIRTWETNDRRMIAAK